MTGIEGEAGSTLIITVWTLSILSLLAIGAGYQAWLETKLTSLQLDHIKEDRLVSAAVALAEQSLPTDLTKPVAAGDAWSKEIDGAKLDEGTFSYTVEDEGSRINLNKASVQTLQALLDDDVPDGAQAVVDWRQKSSDASHESDVDSFYASLPNPYPCKHAEFESIGELNLVQGMTPERYAKLAPQVTVYGDAVNVNTASPQALAALGLGPSVVQKIADARQTGAFTDVSTISQKLTDLSSTDTAQLAAVSPMMTVSSRDFRLHLQLWPGDRPVAGRTPDRYEVVLEFLKKGTWTIKQFSRV